ncbi:hypothetical protein ANN_00918 [Periplaneta americana]|uniref:PiggyBac transposable element-derived protein domain-containing protein n=1 Tax=Periplaneta americana TaxID=6978 RepID=A0ABQ8TS41_PERAM|nr:hypothetical protein ANN_00918 [Periplaneta americana]
MFNAMPYLGKNIAPANQPLADFFVKALTRSVYGTNRNITMDNWFTSIPLASELLKTPYNLTIVGTLRKNKREIPPELLNHKTRKVGTSMICFDQEKTLVSYKTKPNNVVLLLSTTHDTASINPTSKKPDIIEFYNSRKGAVDTLDQMCNQITCSRKTRRWPLCVFYGMVNIALVNSYVIYAHNKISNKEKPLTRRQFGKELHSALTNSLVTHRLGMRNLPRLLRLSMTEILHVNMPVDEPEAQESRKRKICAFCPSKRLRMTKVFCYKCSRAICGERRTICCFECKDGR